MLDQAQSSVERSPGSFMAFVPGRKRGYDYSDRLPSSPDAFERVPDLFRG
jgi:hypothetical protein